MVGQRDAPAADPLVDEETGQLISREAPTES